MDPGGNDKLDGSASLQDVFGDASSVDERLSDMISSDIFRDLFGVETEAQRVGKYTLLGPLGAGGVGAVYRARDEELERDVALKIMATARGDDEDRRRHIEEAKTLAKLSHPNIVHVYEVGTTDKGEVFLAEELVSGRTLREWMDEGEADDWKAVLRIFSQAGRGLAAIHAKGFVHLDFKPRNVVVGDDGRVCVIDLGLARPARRRASTDERALVTAEHDARPDLADNTQARPVQPGRTAGHTEIAGTPPYMAPERWTGEYDERTDQFAFCAALHEALYGAHPFPADAEELRDKIATAEPFIPEDAPRLPKRVKRAIHRGLAKLREDRFPSMDALLAELDVRSRTRARMSALGGAFMLSIGIGLSFVIHSSDEANPCAWAGDHVATLWDDDRVADWRRAVDQSDFKERWPELRSRLDESARDLALARVKVCQDARLEGRLSAALAEERYACLARRIRDLNAVTAPPVVGDDRSVAAKIEATFELARAFEVTECLTIPVSTSGTSEGESLDATSVETEHTGPVVELVQRLAQEQMRHHAGQRYQARAAAEQLMAEIEKEIAAATERTGRKSRRHQLLYAEALYRMATILLRDEDWREAQDNLQTAGSLAFRHGDDDLWLDIELALALLARRHHDNTEIGTVWAKLSIDGSTRVEAWTRHARALDQYGMLLAYDGELQEAEALQREAVNLTRSYGADPFDLAARLSNLANTVARIPGRSQEAGPLFTEAWKLVQATVGPSHPASARYRLSMGRYYMRRGDYETAEEHLRAAVEVWSRIYSCDPGAESDLSGCKRILATALNDLARNELKLALERDQPQRFDGARKRVLQSRAILERIPPTDRLRAMIASRDEFLGVLGFYDRRYEESAAHYRRAFAAREQLLGSNHPDTLQARIGLGEALVELHRYRDALAHFDHVVAHEEALGKRMGWRGILHQGRGLALLGLGQAEAAVVSLQRAQDVLESAGSKAELADVLFGLARAFEATGRGTRAERRGLVERAVQLYSDNNEHFLAQKRTLRDWLADHP